MMKKLTAIFALFAILLSCDKENTNQDTGDNSNSSVEITEISFPYGDEFHVNELDVDGQIMEVTLTPSIAPTSLLKLEVDDESVITAEVVKDGIKVIPHKIGSTKLTVSAAKGPASPKSITVVVKESSEYSEYTINSISANASSVELDDEKEKTKDIVVSLDAKSATLKDVHVSSNKTYVVTAEKITATTLRLTAVAPGEATVTISALRGKGKLSIPVTVFGHITGISIIVPDDIPEGDYKGVFVDSNPTLRANISKTGDLKTGAPAVTWSASSGALFSIDSNTGKMTINKAGGSALSQTVFATCGSFSAHQSIRVYDYVSSVQVKDKLGKAISDEYLESVKTGASGTYIIAFQPATALEYYRVEFSDNAALRSSIDGNTLTLTGQSARYDPITVTIIPEFTKNNAQKAHKIYVDQYSASDLKVGDNVYYDSSSKKFNHSDGGLRYFETKDKCRRSGGGSVSGKGTHIGHIYKLGLETIQDSKLSTIQSQLSGLADANGGHCYVLAKDKGGNYQKWADSDFLVNVSGGSLSSSSSSTTFNDYSCKVTLDNWNSANPSQKVNAHVVALQQNTYTPVAIASASSKGSTGWMLPCVASANLILKYSFWGAGGYTCNQNSSSKVWYFSEYEGSSVYSVNNTDRADVWPILIL